MASRNPAKAVGIDSWVGSIEPGKCGDLLIVTRKNNIPVVRQTYINGEPVAAVQYRNDFVGKDGTRYD